MNPNEYLVHYLNNAAKAYTGPAHPFDFMRGVYLELVRMELRRDGHQTAETDLTVLLPALQWIDEHNDCADFLVPALVRMLHEHRNTHRLPEMYAERIEQSLINFKYWLDEPGEVHACYFTENHQILFHSAEYLVGQLFADRIFPSNGKTGAWHKAHGAAFARRWLQWRIRFGFSEWLTQGYYMEDISALLGLWRYADEEEIRVQSHMLIDMLMFDMAVNGFHGHLPGTHGRVYTAALLNPDLEECSSVMAYAWGEGNLEGKLSNTAALLAVYSYECPKAIQAVALEKAPVLTNKERMSVNVNDALRYGVDPADFNNIMFFWGMQTYSDRLCINQSAKVFPTWNWMLNRVHAYKELYALCDATGIPCEDAPDYTSMTQADIYTRKTPDYIISCAQDFRRGRMGYQQHPWSASLGGRALVFTNSPASEEYNNRPNKWAGNLCLPKAVAHENVVLVIYRILPDFVNYLYMHAYFPQHEFDEVAMKDGWVFGRRGDGYIAMRSLGEARWGAIDPELFRTLYGGTWEQELARARPYEYVAQGHQNVWVFELGSKAENGSFDMFMAGFDHSELTGDSWHAEYRSPSCGAMSIGWDEDLMVNGRAVGIHEYPRYDNPFCHAAFPESRLEIRCGEHTTVLDFDKAERTDI